jgi:hypothetical protein
MSKIILKLNAEELKKKMQLENGKDGLDGKDGKQGQKGEKGDKGADGITPSTTELVSEARKGLLDELLPKIPTTEQLSENIVLKADKVRDVLETLKDDNRLDATAIKNLPEYTEKIIKGGVAGRGIYTYVGGEKKGLLSSIDFVGPTFSKVNGRETLTFVGDSDEKVKYDAGDPTAGYVADKFVAGTGITLSEGTGANENKLEIINSLDLSGYLAIDQTTPQTIINGTPVFSEGIDTTKIKSADSVFIDFEDHIINDSNGIPSIAWDSRQLTDSLNDTSLNWELKQLYGDWAADGSFSIWAEDPRYNITATSALSTPGYVMTSEDGKTGSLFVGGSASAYADTVGFYFSSSKFDILNGSGTTVFRTKTDGDSYILGRLGIGTEVTGTHVLDVHALTGAGVKVFAGFGDLLTDDVLFYYGGDNGVAFVSSRNNHPLSFWANNTEYMRIGTNGNVLVGTTTDNGSNKLQVAGSGIFGGSYIATLGTDGTNAGSFSDGTNSVYLADGLSGIYAQNSINGFTGIIGAENYGGLFYDTDLGFLYATDSSYFLRGQTPASEDVFTVDYSGNIVTTGTIESTSLLIDDTTNSFTGEFGYLSALGAGGFSFSTDDGSLFATTEAGSGNAVFGFTGDMVLVDDTFSDYASIQLKDATGTGTSNFSKGLFSSVGIGATKTNPAYDLDVGGVSATDIVNSDSGYRTLLVTRPTFVNGNLALITGEGGNLDASATYHYSVTFVTNVGETNIQSGSASIATTASDRKVRVTVPVSPDYRVTSRKIYRSVGGGGQYANYLIATIADNTTTTYDDNIADTTAGTNSYFKDNTTVKWLSGSSTFMTAGSNNTRFGIDAGRDAATGGRNSFFGQQCFFYIKNGNDNVGVGGGVGYLSNPTSSVGVGQYAYGAQSENSTVSQSVAIGYQALFGVYDATNRNVTGTTAVGYQAGSRGYTQASSLFGTSAGGRLDGSGANFNTMIGYYAGYGGASPATYSYCVGLGQQAGFGLTSGSYGLYLGNSSGKYASTEVGELIINNYDQGSRALEITDSIIYAQMKDNSPQTQTFRINAGGGINFSGGVDTDVTLNFLGTTNSGVLSWMEDEDYFKFTDKVLVNDKLIFTQTDGNESIDSVDDGYMDYYATIQHRFHADTDIDGDLSANNVLGVHKCADNTPAVADGTYNFDTATAGMVSSFTIKDGIIITITTIAP